MAMRACREHQKRKGYDAHYQASQELRAALRFARVIPTNRNSGDSAKSGATVHFLRW